MVNDGNNDKDSFFYPMSRYYGEFTPENLVFNANIQEFTQKVSYVCNLETNGKITPKEAYLEIKRLWKELKQSKHELFKDEEASDENL